MSQSVKTFLISFSAAFFGLSVLGMAAALTAKPMEAPKQDNNISANVLYLPQPQDSLTALFIGIKDDAEPKEPPMTFMLIRFNPVKGNILVATLPGKCRVSYEKREQTLAELYEEDGVSAVRSAFEQTFGICVQRCGKVPLSSFEKIVNLIGSTNFKLEKNMKINQGKFSLDLAEGIQLIDGKKAEAITQYGGFKTEQERCDTLSNFARDAINQHINLVLSDMSERLFRGIINQMDSDFSFSDYSERKRAAVFMAELKRKPAVAIIPKLVKNSDSSFSISQESAEIFKKRFAN